MRAICRVVAKFVIDPTDEACPSLKSLLSIAIVSAARQMTVHLGESS